jgi:hypothetical protein
MGDPVKCDRRATEDPSRTLSPGSWLGFFVCRDLDRVHAREVL